MTKGFTRRQFVASVKKEKALQMRKEPTKAEAFLWALLRKRQLCEMKFRRQQIIAGFIVDFYCVDSNLVIEVDGDIHEKQKAYDKARDRQLLDVGLKVLHFTNEDVLINTKQVLKEITKNK